ncbi:NADPH oxidase_ EFhand calcium binding domain 5, partial [Caligus rogercresseyi]
EKLEVHIDGPFGAPASSIFRAEHAVLIATGIGVTPFSSILQSIMSRYYDTKRECPNCTYKWSD